MIDRNCAHVFPELKSLPKCTYVRCGWCHKQFYVDAEQRILEVDHDYSNFSWEANCKAWDEMMGDVAAEGYAKLKQLEKRDKMKKYFSRIAVGLLVVALLGVSYIAYEEARVIQYQRHMIVEMYMYIVTSCSAPVSQ